MFRISVICLLLMTGLCLMAISGPHDKDSLKTILKGEKDQVKRALLYNALGDAYSNSDFDSAMHYLMQARDIAKKTSVDSLLAKTYANMGRVSILIGDSPKGMEYLFESLKLYEKTGQELQRVGVLSNIALIYYRNKDLDRALKEFQAIEKLAEVNKEKFGKFYFKLVGTLCNNIGIIYDNKKQHNEALQSFMKGLTMSERANDKSNMATLYVNIAKSYQATKQFSLAATNFEESLRIRTETNDRYGICRSMGHLGSLYLERGDIAKAEDYLDKALAMSRELGSPDTEANTAQVMVDLYQKQGKFEKALTMLQLQKELDDSLRNDGVARKILQVEMQYEFEKKRRDAESAQERRQLMFFIIVGISVSLAVIAGLLYYLQRIRANNEKLQKDNLQLANGNLTLEKKALEENLEFKNKELTTNVMYLMKKNEMLIDMSERLMEVKRNAKKEDQDRIQRIIVELNTAKDNDVWEEFELRFNQVYNDFYERLMSRFPNLSSNDRKLCAFLRLNMSSKEICAITRQNLNSLNVARARLRKKLGIENPDTSLQSFLEQI